MECHLIEKTVTFGILSTRIFSLDPILAQYSSTLRSYDMIHRLITSKRHRYTKILSDFCRGCALVNFHSEQLNATRHWSRRSAGWFWKLENCWTTTFAGVSTIQPFSGYQASARENIIIKSKQHDQKLTPSRGKSCQALQAWKFPKTFCYQSYRGSRQFHLLSSPLRLLSFSMFFSSFASQVSQWKNVPQSKK